MRHLDTCIVIAYLNGNKAIAEKLKSHLPDIAINSLVLGELLYGARASARSSENPERLKKFVNIVDIADYDEKSADAYSKNPPFSQTDRASYRRNRYADRLSCHCR